jgi:hypothetical protein
MKGVNLIVLTALIFAPAVVVLFVWLARTRKYAQALLAITSLGAVYSCIAGASAIHHDGPWFGVAMIALGLAALFCVAIAFFRLRSPAARPSPKLLIATAAVAGLLCPGGVTFLQSRAPDFWGYGKLGLSDRTTPSPVFFVEVRGVGHRPTVAYIVRCPDRSTAPKNMLDVSHTVITQFDKRTRVMDRWRSECILLVGRSVGETIEIPLDRATAQKWFGPGALIGEFIHCQKFWDEVVSPRIMEFDRTSRGTG